MTRDSIEKAVRRARKAAKGDSNDAEIEALQDALDEALSALDRDSNGAPK